MTPLTSLKRAAAALLLFASSSALAADPTAEDLLKKYDAVMGPGAFEADTEMTAWREDGTSRTYRMKFLRADAERMRVWFVEPASVKGQEVLRVGDNLWLYLPNLKRATRMANRDNFQGGDFNNADVMRVKYAEDYSGKLTASDDPALWKVELKAKNANTSYDAIKLWFRRSDSMPARGEYYGTSGQLLRSAEFSDFKEFGKGYVRPAKVVMRNELVKARRSEMVFKTLELNADVPPQRFSQTDLGR
jgi:outer membrane lipoprotein-sorting protein